MKTHRALRWLAASAVAFSAFLVLGTNPAHAFPGNIVNINSGRCMDVKGESRAEGAKVIIYDCKPGKANQVFSALVNGEIRVYGDMCLDASGGYGNNLDPIIIFRCTGGANQRWYRQSDGTIRGINGRCIDVRGGTQGNDSELILFDCHGGWNQQWYYAGSEAPEQCFGGIGPKCDGAPLAPADPRASDGTQITWVAVGSIAHDNCCVRNPLTGAWCTGPFTNDSWSAPCKGEWEKAVRNTREGKRWRVIFGPYTIYNPADDTSPTVGRKMGLPTARGGRDVPQWPNESGFTRRLSAPSGTKMDPDDEEFCVTGRFSAKTASDGWCE